MSKKRILNEKEQELYNELKKLSKRANQRLVRLEREFGQNTWASKKLKDRLSSDLVQAWTNKGRVKINKNMSIAQMRASIKATEQFLNSKTSTVKGIKQVTKRIKKDIKKSLSTEEQDLSDEEVESLYNLFSEDYAKDLIDKIGASELWTEILDAKEFNDNEEDFIDRIKNYLDFGNDDDMIEKLQIIYEKYVL